MEAQFSIVYNYLLREEFIDEDGDVYHRGKYVVLTQPFSSTIEDVNFYLSEFYFNQVNTI